MCNQVFSEESCLLDFGRQFRLVMALTLLAPVLRLLIFGHDVADLSSPEGQSAWSDLVHLMNGNFDKVKADIFYTDQEPIRSGLLDEDTVGDIFQVIPVSKGQEIDFPIDFYQATDRDKFWAYAIPDQGYLPQRYASSDSVKISTYRIGSSIDLWIRHIEQARWDILSRGLEVYRNAYVKKINSDGWSTLAAAAYYRNIVISDDSAAPNQITPRLLSLMQVFMKRNGGGNMNSSGFQLTDLYISPEAAASMRSWDLSLVPEVVREQMFAKKAGVPNCKVPKTPSFRRKPESRRATRNLVLWIPAWYLFSLSFRRSGAVFGRGSR